MSTEDLAKKYAERLAQKRSADDERKRANEARSAEQATRTAAARQELIDDIAPYFEEVRDSFPSGAFNYATTLQEGEVNGVVFWLEGGRQYFITVEQGSLSFGRESEKGSNVRQPYLIGITNETPPEAPRRDRLRAIIEQMISEL